MENICEMKYHTVGYDNLSRRQHTHTGCHELLFCHSDGGSMLVDDSLYPIKRNTLFIINADYIHCSNPDNPRIYERSAILINTNYLRSVFSVIGITDMLGGFLPPRGGIRIMMSPETGDFVEKCFGQMYAASRGQSQYKRAIITNLMLTVMFRLQGEEKHDVSRGDSSLMGDILEFINLNLSDDVSADRIAARVGLDRSYLCRLFRRKTTMTLTQYVTEQRLSLARSMLLQTDQNILEVALACGFGSPSYFCRVFREVYGATPHSFRLSNKGRNEVIPGGPALSSAAEDR